MLNDKGYKVFLFGDRSSDRRPPDSVDRVPVETIASIPADPTRREILAYWMRLIAALWRFRDRFDVLHVHAVNFFHAPAIPVARLLNKPVLVRSSLEGELPHPTRSKSEWLHYQCLRLADRFVVISRRLKREYLEGGIPDRKIERIANGVDTNRYTPVTQSKKKALRRRLGLPQAARIITYHGVFIARKSIDWVLPLMERYLARTDLVLLLVGGPGRDEHRTRYFERLKRSAERSRARDSIIFTGFQKDVEHYLQASDLYLLPSTGEGLPNALLEAMAVGLISVVSRTSGSEEVVEDAESGFLFEPRNEDSFRSSLEDAISAAKSDDRQEISAAAAERIRSEFSIDKIAGRYGREYSRISADA